MQDMLGCLIAMQSVWRERVMKVMAMALTFLTPSVRMRRSSDLTLEYGYSTYVSLKPCVFPMLEGVAYSQVVGALVW
jgi:hypothetical protein